MTNAITIMKSALSAIATYGGNLSDDALMAATGPNDAAARGIMYVNARDTAQAALREVGDIQDAEQMLIDAQRWRALMSSQRMHLLGTGGFLYNGPRSEEGGIYVHDPATEVTIHPAPSLLFGMEFHAWHGTHGDPRYSDAGGRKVITAYVDYLRSLAGRTPADAARDAHKAEMAKRDNDLMDEIEQMMEEEDLPAISPAIRSDRQIVDQTNELARLMMEAMFGMVAPYGHKFYEAEDPRSKRAWAQACRIQEVMTATDPNDALSGIDPEDAGGADEAGKLRAAIERMRPLIRTIHGAVSINESMGRVVEGQADAAKELHAILADLDRRPSEESAADCHDDCC